MSKLVEMEDHFNSEVTTLKGDVQRSTQETKGIPFSSPLPPSFLSLSRPSLSLSLSLLQPPPSFLFLLDHVSAERLKFEHKVHTERDEERTYWSGKIDSKIEALFVEEKARAKMEIGEFKDETKIWLVSEVLTLPAPLEKDRREEGRKEEREGEGEEEGEGEMRLMFDVRHRRLVWKLSRMRTTLLQS